MELSVTNGILKETAVAQMGQQEIPEQFPELQVRAISRKPSTVIGYLFSQEVVVYLHY